jgi:two-component system copper resistance phosphate regulon response regulator CusR
MVEDDGQVAGFVREGLTRQGFAVDIAGDDLEGLELALHGTYDTMIVDIRLPGMSGLSCCSASRAGITTPILILSGMAEVSDRVTGLQLGDDYLVKPLLSPSCARRKSMRRAKRLRSRFN